MVKLDEESLARALKDLPEWRKVDGRRAIARTFRFKDFNEAFAFMTCVALLAEKMDHHPEWFNVYNRVEVTLSTYDAGGITDKDLTMAQAMNSFAAQV